MKLTQVTKKIDFSGETIYVGLDVHKKQWTVTIRTSLVEHKTFVQPPSAHTLGNYLKRNFPNADYKSAYEAGFCGFWIHYALLEEGIGNIVINGSDIPTTHKEKSNKRDKVDSRKICKSLAAGLLTGIFIPTKVEAEEKEVIRLRRKVVNDITRCKNRITSFLDRRGIRFSDSLSTFSLWTGKHILWLEGLELETHVGTSSLKIMIRELKELTKLLKELERHIIKNVQEKYAEEFRLLKTVSGVGAIASVTVLAELGDTSRFPNVDHLTSFVGLIPNSHGSGEKEHFGNMTKRKNSYLQPILIQSAWMALRRDPSLTKKYHKWCNRMKASKAIVRVARQLLIRIRYVLINRKPYEILVN